MEVEAHGLAVDGDEGAKVEPGRQVALVECDPVHERALA
jgi:hypothetical protein